MTDLATVLARMVEQEERDCAEGGGYWHDYRAWEHSRDMLATPEGKALAALVEAVGQPYVKVGAWADGVLDAYDAYREVTK